MSAKLRQKNKENSDQVNSNKKLTISGLTEKIRNSNTNISNKTIEKKANEKQVENDFDKSNHKKDTILSDLLEKIKGSDYECTEVLYVDKQIKEVFTMLKAKGKIPISSLTSHILEEWLIANAKSISSIIKKDNRFL